MLYRPRLSPSRWSPVSLLGLALWLGLAPLAGAAERAPARIETLLPGAARIEPGIGAGRLVVKDARGRRVGTVEQGIGGRLIIRNTRGARVGTVQHR